MCPFLRSASEKNCRGAQTERRRTYWLVSRFAWGGTTPAAFPRHIQTPQSNCPTDRDSPNISKKYVPQQKFLTKCHFACPLGDHPAGSEDRGLNLPIANDSTQTEDLLKRISRGDRAAVGLLLEAQRNYLRRLIDLRMENDLRGRVDPSDVVQETLLVVSRRVKDFIERRPTTFRLWIRRKAIERLIELRRKHRAGKRSVRREMRLSDASSMAVARRLTGDSPSQALDRQDLANRARLAIQSLNELDREVILLRHVEELTNAEVAELLNITPDAASKRYGRAIRRLSEIMLQLEN